MELQGIPASCRGLSLGSNSLLLPNITQIGSSLRSHPLEQQNIAQATTAISPSNMPHGVHDMKACCAQTIRKQQTCKKQFLTANSSGELPKMKTKPAASEEPGVAWKKDFPLLSHSHPKLVYLDSAATTHKPLSVVDAMTEFYTKHYATVHRAVYGMALHATHLQHQARKKIQSFINAASSDEIVFTRGATESINLVASCFDKSFIKPGDEIVVTEIEHHANLVPWQMLCHERGARLQACQITEKGDIDLDDLQRLLSSGKVKLVACAHMSNVLGTVHPIDKIAQMSHSYGAKVLVDGAQMVAHGSIDVQSLGVDFYAFSGHKMYGPTGVGVLYGRKELLSAMPPYHGGGDMVQEVSLQSTTFQDPPLKFEAGTPPAAEIVGLGAAVDYLHACGLENIQKWEKELTCYALQRLSTVPGVQILGKPAVQGPIISFTVKGLHHLDIGTLLDLKGISVRTGHHCCQTAMSRFQVPGTVRLSLGLYNTYADIDAFIQALQQIVQDLLPKPAGN